MTSLMCKCILTHMHELTRTTSAPHVAIFFQTIAGSSVSSPNKLFPTHWYKLCNLRGLCFETGTKNILANNQKHAWRQ